MKAVAIDDDSVVPRIDLGLHGRLEFGRSMGVDKPLQDDERDPFFDRCLHRKRIRHATSSTALERNPPAWRPEGKPFDSLDQLDRQRSRQMRTYLNQQPLGWQALRGDSVRCLVGLPEGIEKGELQVILTLPAEMTSEFRLSSQIEFILLKVPKDLTRPVENG